MGTTEDVAGWVAAFDHERIPAVVVDRARSAIVDTVAALEERIEVCEDRSIPGVRTPVDGGYVEVAIRTLDGGGAACRVEEAAGSPGRPLSTSQLQEKFRACAHGLGQAQVERALRALGDLEDLPELRTLVRDLCPEETG